MTDYILTGDIENKVFGATRKLILEVHKVKKTTNYGYKSLDRGELVYKGVVKIPLAEKRREKTPLDLLKESFGINYTTSGGHITFNYKDVNTSGIVINGWGLNRIKRLTEALYELGKNKIAPELRE